MEPSVEPFVALMRRYCIDYTARHDLSVCDDIMVPGYTLHMGVHHLAGRDEAYKPAAAAQFRQFPGLCLTVNEIICSGDRLALRFTEHGASARHDGARAAWGGVGVYRWDGQRLLVRYSSAAALNIGMVTSVLPVSGVPLPFISAGGSSLVILMVAAGILANVARRCESRSTARPA